MINVSTIYFSQLRPNVVAMKAIVLLNVLNFWEPLRNLIETSIHTGFISEADRRLITFVDGPTALEEHESFDWGNCGLDALNRWEYSHT